MNNRIVCDISNHDEYIKYLCVHELCEYRSACCQKCVMIYHLEHKNECIPMDQIHLIMGRSVHQNKIFDQMLHFVQDLQIRMQEMSIKLDGKDRDVLSELMNKDLGMDDLDVVAKYLKHNRQKILDIHKIAKNTITKTLHQLLDVIQDYSDTINQKPPKVINKLELDDMKSVQFIFDRKMSNAAQEFTYPVYKSDQRVSNLQSSIVSILPALRFVQQDTFYMRIRINQFDPRTSMVSIGVQEDGHINNSSYISSDGYLFHKNTKTDSFQFQSGLVVVVIYNRMRKSICYMKEQNSMAVKIEGITIDGWSPFIYIHNVDVEII